MEQPVDETLPDGVFFLRVNAANLLLAHVVLALVPPFFIDDPGFGTATWITVVMLIGLAANVPVFFLKRGRSLGWAIPHVIETFMACGLIQLGVALWAITREDVKMWSRGRPLPSRPSSTRWVLAAVLSLFSSGLVLGVAGLFYLGWLERPANQVVKDEEAHVVYDTEPSGVEPVTEEYETWAIYPDFSIWNLSDERGNPVITTEVSSTCDDMCDDQIEASGKAAGEAGARHVVIHNDCPGESDRREPTFDDWRKLSPEATFLCQVDQGGREWMHVPSTRIFDSLGHLRYFNDGENVGRSKLVGIVEKMETVLPTGTDRSIHPSWQGTWCGESEGFLTMGRPLNPTPRESLEAYHRLRRFLAMRIEVHTELGVTVTAADGTRLPMSDVLYSDSDHLSVINRPEAPAELFGSKLHFRKGDDVYAVLMINDEVVEWTVVPAGEGRCSTIWDGESEPPEPPGDEAEWASRPPGEWPLIVLDQEIVLEDGRRSSFGAAFLLLEEGKLALGSARGVLGATESWDQAVTPRELDSLLETWSVFPHFDRDNSIDGTVRITTYPDGFRDAIAIGVNQRPDNLPAQPLTVRDQRVRPGEKVFLVICEVDAGVCRQRPLPARVELVEPERFAFTVDCDCHAEGMKGAPVVDSNGQLVGVLTDRAVTEEARQETVFFADFAEFLQYD